MLRLLDTLMVVAMPDVTVGFELDKAVTNGYDSGGRFPTEVVVSAVMTEPTEKL